MWSGTPFNVDDYVLLQRNREGIIKFKGKLSGKKETFYGITLTVGCGDCNGEYKDKQYFQCKEGQGIFVLADEIIWKIKKTAAEMKKEEEVDAITAKQRQRQRIDLSVKKATIQALNASSAKKNMSNDRDDSTLFAICIFIQFLTDIFCVIGGVISVFVGNKYHGSDTLNECLVYYNPDDEETKATDKAIYRIYFWGEIFLILSSIIFIMSIMFYYRKSSFVETCKKKCPFFHLILAAAAFGGVVVMLGWCVSFVGLNTGIIYGMLDVECEEIKKFCWAVFLLIFPLGIVRAYIVCVYGIMLSGEN